MTGVQTCALPICLGVARQWKLPERIIATMKAAPTESLTNTDESRLCALAELSNRMADAAVAPNERVRAGMMQAIGGDFGKPLGLEPDQLDAVLRSAALAFTTEVKTLGLPVGSGAFEKGLRSFAAAAAAADATGAPAQQTATGTLAPRTAAGTLAPRTATGVAAVGVGPRTAHGAAEGTWVRVGAGPAPAEATAFDSTIGVESALAATMLNTAVPEMDSEAPGMNPQARANMLSAGIQDITNTLAGAYQLNDLLRIILETMYRAIGFTRVMLCTRHPQSNSLRGRLGFGADADAIIKRGFQVPLAVSKDVFYGAISKSADICIEDRDSERVRAYIPAWYRDAVQARGFVLFPVIVNRKPMALIYADHEEAGRLRFADGELNLLKMLRNQAILAIQQKSGG